MKYEWMDALKAAMDEYRPAMLKAEREIWAHPETGFKEWFANGLLKDIFTEMGFELVEAGDIPGFYFDIDTGREGPTVCVMGELDSVICPEHPEADPVTGAVHSCGHNCQSSALIGVAGALKKPEILEKLSGKIRIMAVPAEELLELGYRAGLRAEGKIKYMGGKVEFISRGYFDGVDMAVLVHTSCGEGHTIYLNKGNNGCVVKNITYTGKAAHAGGYPQGGINALYAAQVGITAVNSLRETFADNDHIRVHPIITSGGAIVNAIPAKVTMESYTRGASYEAIKNANKKVNRALVAGALALGAQVQIEDLPGYMPLNNDPNMNEIYKEASVALFGEDGVKVTNDWGSGCTDVGDVSCIMPAVQACCNGAKGTGHGADYYVVEPDKAVVDSAASQVATVCVLLEKGAEKARYVKENSKPLYPSKEEFLKAIDSIMLEGDAIDYKEDGSACVRWTNPD
ncbi:MAG: amidohydrolase [Clostridia bacterium]|nr:amidohydrolase [Clostridia bacterium]